MVSDLADDGMVQAVMDFGTEQTSLWSEFRSTQHELWQEERFMRLPTKELAEQVRYKAPQTAETLYLFPNEAQALPEKKSGCPFADLV